MSLAFLHAHDGAERTSRRVLALPPPAHAPLLPPSPLRRSLGRILDPSGHGREHLRGRTIKQWDSISGQVSRARAPHTLGLVSLSVDPTGRHALYNTLEGLTCLWDLEDGEDQGDARELCAYRGRVD
ncbi:hypothetical protein NUW54_g4204 [Trametes sanguinea]|uniref:Uncharacterized protein n=1 Tax=Trametes sanguinea TaxID=158606 RepID=A0ACC1PZ56_9APHY|nr:hypothetical protein NUW54_g4204 [Trametes sanguinea]